MANEELEFRPPAASEDATRSIWTPTEVDYIQSWVVGMTEGSGERVLKHEFRLNYKGQTQMFGVVAEESASEGQIEDMAARVAERSALQMLEKLQKRGSKLAPEQLASREHIDLRRDVAGAFRDYIKHAKQRAQSSTGKIYFKGIT